MPLASLELPSRAFPSRGAVPALAGRCFRAGSLSDYRRRNAAGRFAIAFAAAPALCPYAPPGGGSRTHEPGRQFPAVASRSLGHAAKRDFADRPFPSTLGSPVSSRHARFEALLPSGVRSPDDPMPWPGRGRRVGALLGFFPSRACSTTVQGPVSRVGARGRDEPCTSYVAGNSAASLRSRDPSSDAWGHEPRIRQCAEPIEPRTPPSDSDPAVNRISRTRLRQPPAPPAACATCEAICPRPLFGGAPRLPRP
jgi:hypothetical protein